METLDLLVDKLDALGVLVVVIAYLLIKEKLSPNKKLGNPNGVIKAIERSEKATVDALGKLEKALNDHTAHSGASVAVIMERLSNMGTNMAGVFTLLGEIKTACIQMTERARNPE